MVATRYHVLRSRPHRRGIAETVMHNAILNGIPFRGRRQGPSGQQPQSLPPLPVTVSYRDGAVLTFLFDRATPIRDLSATIRRAGPVRKVVL